MKERGESKSTHKLDAVGERDITIVINKKMREVSWCWRKIQQRSFGGIKEKIIRNKPFLNIN